MLLQEDPRNNSLVCYAYYQMGLLKRYDFNKWTGWLSIIFVSIGISFVIFAVVYFIEGNII